MIALRRIAIRSWCGAFFCFGFMEVSFSFLCHTPVKPEYDDKEGWFNLDSPVKPGNDSREESAGE